MKEGRGGVCGLAGHVLRCQRARGRGRGRRQRERGAQRSGLRTQASAARGRGCADQWASLSMCHRAAGGGRRTMKNRKSIKHTCQAYRTEARSLSACQCRPPSCRSPMYMSCAVRVNSMAAGEAQVQQHQQRAKSTELQRLLCLLTRT